MVCKGPLAVSKAFRGDGSGCGVYIGLVLKATQGLGLIGFLGVVFGLIGFIGFIVFLGFRV